MNGNVFEVADRNAIGKREENEGSWGNHTITISVKRHERYWGQNGHMYFSRIQKQSYCTIDSYGNTNN